jgi:uncharacterized protein (TIGR02246 family)
MNKKTNLILFAVLVVAVGVANADEADLDAIRGTAKAFVDAFDAGDAAAVAALWAEDADYRDEGGVFFHGRDAIQQAYAELFAENPGHKLELSVEALRQVGPDLAIEDGVSFVSPPVAGPPVAGRYTATHVRQDGQWRIESVREWSFEVDSNYSHLQPLEWLIGNWVATSPGRTSEMKFEWTKNKNFIKRTFTIKKGDEDYTITTGTQVIGYDPSTDQIRSWLFDSDAGFAETVWTVEEDGLVGHSNGVLIDGSKTQSTDILKRDSEDHFTVQSVDRTIDGDSVADGEVIEVARVGGGRSLADVD